MIPSSCARVQQTLNRPTVALHGSRAKYVHADMQVNESSGKEHLSKSSYNEHQMIYKHKTNVKICKRHAVRVYDTLFLKADILYEPTRIGVLFNQLKDNDR